MQNLETTISSLIRAVGAGNEEAVEKFKAIYVPSILSYCRRYCIDEATAQAATLETVKSMIQKTETFDRKKHRSFRAYLFRVVNSKTADQKRMAFAKEKRDERDWAKRLNQDLVRQALAKAKRESNISKSSWEQFHLHYEQGWTREAIAEKFGIETDSVRRSLLRCAKKINEQLEPFADTDCSTTQEKDS